MSLIKTNDNCVGCNSCIRACSCVGANVAEEVDGKNRIVLLAVLVLMRVSIMRESS